MPTKPSILKRATVARSRLFRADEIHLRFSNGEERTYEKLCSGGPGAVLIVPLLDENTVLLVREYAAGIEDYHLALPKGAIDQGETLLDAAIFIRVLEKRQGQKVASPEESAYRMGFIDAAQLEVMANKYAKNGYGQYLKQVLTERVF